MTGLEPDMKSTGITGDTKNYYQTLLEWRKSTVDHSKFEIVEYKGDIGFLLWDNNRPERVNFPGRTWYQVQESYRITADVESLNSEHLVTVHYGKGDIIERPVKAMVHFNLLGEEMELVAFEAVGEKRVRWPDGLGGKS